MKNLSRYLVVVLLVVFSLGSLYSLPHASSHKSPTHVVFLEEGTASWCSHCPSVSESIHDLYENQAQDYEFSYVTMIYDRNERAYSRLVDDYHMHGFPTIYCDGGHQVIVGEQDEAAFEEAILVSANREVANLAVELTVQWNDPSQDIEVIATVVNFEPTTYTGRLRVYVTEIVSRWADLDGKAYHFGFIDYALDEQIQIAASDSLILSDLYPIGDLDVDNLQFFAVVFTDDSEQGYSDPPDGSPFDAYYAEAVATCTVIEGGNLPPGVGIAIPRYLRYHLFSRVIWTVPFYQHTFLFGRTTMRFEAQDDSAIEKIEIMLKGPLREFTTTLEEEPYEWRVENLLGGNYHLTATAYDDQGKHTTAEMDVFIFML